MIMGDIFLKLLNMSIAASWLILAVLLLRLLLKKTPKWIHCLLWSFVAVRLICPFSIESAYSLIPSAKTVQTNKITDEDGHISQNIPMIDNRVPVVSNVVNPILRETFVYEGEENAAPIHIYMYAAGIVWCCGVLLLLTYAFIGWLRIRNMVKEAVCHRDNIYLCDAVKAPFIYGVIRPRIYLPSGVESDMREYDYVIAHEQAHLKRKDHWWKPLGYLLLAVYWFNPLCWIAYVLLCRDIEFACDEKVIRDMSLNEKKEYSKALLSCSTQKRGVRICPLAFGEISVKGRIKSILNYKKAPFIILLAAVVVCVIVGILFLTNPPREYQIRVTIPAGSNEGFSYSDEEVCPKGSTLTVYAGEGLGDAEIVLLPVESKENKVYAPTYITPGMPVKFETEKGAWYKIGLNVQNPADENRDIYVSVNHVDVRIASIADGTEKDGNSGQADGAGMEERYKGTLLREEYKAILLGEEDFVAIDFRDGDRSVNVENIGEIVSDEDVAAEVTKFAIIDLDGNGEDELVLWIQWLGDRVFGYEILFYQDQEVYGFTLPDRGFVNPKTDGTFDYLGGIDHSGTGRLQFTEKGHKIVDVSDSESQVNKPDLGWYDLTPESVETVYQNRFRYDMGDLDGNGEKEYLVISYEKEFSEYNAHLNFYFNDKSIYEYDDLLIMSPGDAEYIDLDLDGEPEIFFTFYPHVNSMPLVEYAVLKRTGSGWKALEMIHGEDMLDNAFPISVKCGKEEYNIVISCEGLEKQIVYNYKAYYEARVKEGEENRMDLWEYKAILSSYKQLEAGDDFGGIASWGVWNINSGIYEGKNCLIAAHGLEGPVGKSDILGEIDIYFNYNEKGLVNILNMEFRGNTR